MRHRNHKRKFHRTTGYRRALFVNLAMSLIQHEQIRTTLPKAKSLRPFVERLVTLGKKGMPYHHRLAWNVLHDKATVSKLFTTLAQRYQQRPGGYTRIIREGIRYGDASLMAVIEFVERNPDAKGKSIID